MFCILGIMQYFWYSSEKRRERFVKMCADPDVQRLTWEAYMNKELVRAKPGRPYPHLFSRHGALARHGQDVSMQRGKRWEPVATAACAAIAVAAIGGTLTDLGSLVSKPERALLEAAGCRLRTDLDRDFFSGGGGRRYGLARGPQPAGAAMDSGSVRGQRFLQRSLEPGVFQACIVRISALVEVAALWLSILVLILFLYRRAPLAGLLMVPYLIWVSIAAALNYQVVVLNGPFV